MMRERVPVLLGVFCVMALSNAVVPVLTRFSPSTFEQSAIFSAYFLGAFLFTVPTGVLSDKAGPVLLIRFGLIISFLSGIVLCIPGNFLTLIGFRFLEGVGSGLFVAAGLSFVNSGPDHEAFAGYFIAVLNLGLVAGLIITGFLVDIFHNPLFGMYIFTTLLCIPLVTSKILRNRGDINDYPLNKTVNKPGIIRAIGMRNFWLFWSVLVLLGVTGGVTAIYPDYSDMESVSLGLIVAGMNIATMCSSLLSAHAHLPPLKTIRVAAIISAFAVLLCMENLLGFILLGFLSGFVIISQLSYLSYSEKEQGTTMGLYNMATYGGMTIIPAISGLISEKINFVTAFIVIALLSLSVVLTIGRCNCSIIPLNEVKKV